MVFRPGAGSAGVGAWPTATMARDDSLRGGWGERSRTDSGASEASFRLGEDIVHAAFGDGVVTGVEPGGVIVVRFAGDGSERKLMAEYAPVTRR